MPKSKSVRFPDNFSGNMKVDEGMDEIKQPLLLDDARSPDHTSCSCNLVGFLFFCVGVNIGCLAQEVSYGASKFLYNDVTEPKTKFDVIVYCLIWILGHMDMFCVTFIFVGSVVLYYGSSYGNFMEQEMHKPWVGITLIFGSGVLSGNFALWFLFVCFNVAHFSMVSVLLNLSTNLIVLSCMYGSRKQIVEYYEMMEEDTIL